MTQLNLIKISADGAQLPADATKWDAVLLPDHGLMFSATHILPKDRPQQECIDACASLTLAGFSDWTLPSIEQLQLVIDRTRYRPAINTDYFRNIQSDWYWTSSEFAGSSASAWFVYFFSGNVYGLHRSLSGFALAVREVQP